MFELSRIYEYGGTEHVCDECLCLLAVSTEFTTNAINGVIWKSRSVLWPLLDVADCYVSPVEGIPPLVLVRAVHRRDSRNLPLTGGGSSVRSGKSLSC